MKKLLFLFSAVIMLTLASCSGGKDAEAIYGKIQAGEEITQNDYHKMIDYIKVPLMDAVKELKDCKSITEVQEKMGKLSEKYPFVQPFTQYLTLHVNDMSAENQEDFSKITEELQKLLQ